MARHALFVLAVIALLLFGACATSEQREEVTEQSSVEPASNETGLPPTSGRPATKEGTGG